MFIAPLSKLERTKDEEMKGRIGSRSLVQVYMIHLPTVHMCTKFQPSRHQSSEKNNGNFYSSTLKIERKKNKEINGRISRSSLIPVYTIHLSSVHVCTKS